MKKKVPYFAYRLNYELIKTELICVCVHGEGELSGAKRRGVMQEYLLFIEKWYLSFLR